MKTPILLALCIAFAVAACGGAQQEAGLPLTPADVAHDGTHIFQAPRDKVFKAAVGALKSDGYEIAWADESSGVIKTGRKRVRVVTAASVEGTSFQSRSGLGAQSATGVAESVECTRQYVLKLAPDGNATTVSAEPRVFMGERDLSTESVWELDGPDGERTLWARLFKAIGEAL